MHNNGWKTCSRDNLCLSLPMVKPRTLCEFSNLKEDKTPCDICAIFMAFRCPRGKACTNKEEKGFTEIGEGGREGEGALEGTLTHANRPGWPTGFP